jgi:hypothetical protein
LPGFGCCIVLTNTFCPSIFTTSITKASFDPVNSRFTIPLLGLGYNLIFEEADNDIELGKSTVIVTEALIIFVGLIFTLYPLQLLKEVFKKVSKIFIP